MAHEVDSMIWVGDRPWHGLGLELSNSPSVDDAIRLAGLDWNVRVDPLYMKNRYDEYVPAPAKVTIRESDERLLGVVKPGYTVLQNKEAFDWIRPFVENNQVKLEVAGSLRHGRRIFILARLMIDPIDVAKGDAVTCYLLLANGHDGTMAAWVALTPIRVVCANTLAAALDSDGSKLMRVVHGRQVVENLALVRDTIDLARRDFVASAELYAELAKRQIGTKELRSYVKKVFYPMADTRKRADTKSFELNAADAMFDRVLPLFEHGRGNDIQSIRHSWWAAYNAINEHLAYERGRSQNVRLDSLWFGNGGSVNRRALQVAQTMSFDGSN